MRLLLVRHASVDARHRGVWLGRRDVPLAPEGVAEADRLARLLELRGERPGRIYTSPRLRAVETARRLALKLEVPVEATDALDEMDLGLVEGRRPEELSGEAAALWREYLRDIYLHPVPGGEAFRQLEERVLRFVDGLAPTSPAPPLLVTHTGPLLALVCRALGLDPRLRPRLHIDTASLSAVTLAPPALLLLNEKPGLLDGRL